MEHFSFVRTCTNGTERSIDDLSRRIAHPADLHVVRLDTLDAPEEALTLFGPIGSRVMAAWSGPDFDRGARLLADAVAAGATRIRVEPAFLAANGLDAILGRPGGWAIATQPWPRTGERGCERLDAAFGKDRPRVYTTLDFPPGRDAWHVAQQWLRPPTDGLHVRVDARSEADWYQASRLYFVASDCNGLVVEGAGPWARAVACRPQDFHADWIVLHDPAEAGSDRFRLRASPALDPVPVGAVDPSRCEDVALRLNGFFESGALPYQAIPVPCRDGTDLLALSRALYGPYAVRAERRPQGCKFPDAPFGPEDPDLVWIDPDDPAEKTWQVLQTNGFVEYAWPPDRPRTCCEPAFDLGLARLALASVMAGRMFRCTFPIPYRTRLLLNALRGINADTQCEGDGFVVSGPFRNEHESAPLSTVWAADVPELVPLLAVLAAGVDHGIFIDGTDALRSTDFEPMRKALRSIDYNSAKVGTTPGLPIASDRIPRSWFRVFHQDERTDYDNPDLSEATDAATVAAILLAAPVRTDDRKYRVSPAMLATPEVLHAIDILTTMGTGRAEDDGVRVCPAPPSRRKD